MNDDDERWLGIAGLILDGQPVAWDAVPGGHPQDVHSADALRVIADVASLHRSGEPLRRWGTLAIQEQIGHGTFGDVYRARDTTLDREVALKLVDHTSSATTLDEGRLLARVRHSNVVIVHGAAIHDGRYGIWMEFIRGRTLAAVVRQEGPLNPEDVTAIGIDVCRALTAVHESGLLHGDIKPQNVMREEGGRIVVMDFGTGRVVKDSVGDGRLVGTPLYLAPEVLSGAAPDIRADVYAAGVLLYYLLTAAHPVEGSTLNEIRAAHESGARTPIRFRRPEVPRSLAAVVERAIAPEPLNRFDGAAAFEHALRDLLPKRSQAISRRYLVLTAAGVLMSTLAGGYWRISATQAEGQKALATELHNKSFAFGASNDWKSALDLVNSAIAADDTSGLAHAWKAWCLHRMQSRPSAVVAEARRAHDMSSSLEWERLWIEATYNGFTNQPNPAVTALTQLVKLRPDSYWAVSTLADTLRSLGRRREALPYFIQGAELGSRDGAFLIRAGSELLTLGGTSYETGSGLLYARRTRSIASQSAWFPGAPSAWTLPIEASLRRGDLLEAAAALDAARAECSQLDGDRRTDLAATLVIANLSLGRWRGATEVAELLPRPHDRHFSRAVAAFHSGQRQLFRQEISLMGEGPHSFDLFYLIETGYLDVSQSQLDRLQAAGRAALDPEKARSPQDRANAAKWLAETRMPLQFPRSVDSPFESQFVMDRLQAAGRAALEVIDLERGRLLLARGDVTGALRLLQSVRPSFAPQSIYRFEYLADIHVQQKDFARAIATLEDSLQYRSEPLQALWWMRNELRLAELYKAAGRDADARPLMAHLQKLLVAADPDFPLLVRLRALERRTQPVRTRHPQ